MVTPTKRNVITFDTCKRRFVYRTDDNITFTYDGNALKRYQQLFGITLICVAMVHTYHLPTNHDGFLALFAQAATAPKKYKYRSHGVRLATCDDTDAFVAVVLALLGWFITVLIVLLSIQ